VNIGRPRTLSFVVFAAVAAVSAGGLLAARAVIDNEASRLLAERAHVVAGEVSSAMTATDTSLQSLATLLSLPDGRASFRAAASALVTGNVRAIALVDMTTGVPTPTVVVGDGLPAGSLGSQRAGLAERALGSSDMVTGVVDDSYTRRLALALAVPPDVGPFVVYEETTVELTNPFAADSVADTNDVEVAFYASAHASPDSLIEQTGAMGTPGAVAARTTVGTDQWTVVVAPIRPLAGGFASAVPWLLLAGGLVSALLGAVSVEVVLRRRDFAMSLVDARTADLRASLDEVQRTQRQLLQAQDALMEHERLAAVGQMASVVSHELRNPLTSVINSLYLVRHGSSPESVARALDMAEREVQKAATIAEDVVAYSRPRQPEPSDVLFGSAVDEVLEVVPPPPSVELRLSGRDVVVHADRIHLVEVLTNLVENAVDAMPDGGTLSIGAESEPGGVHGPRTVVVVSDTGTGIDPEEAARIFEPFVTSKHHGTGLGLAIVHRIARLHGGEATVESVPGAGSRFTVVFPSPGAAPPPAPDRGAAATASRELPAFSSVPR